MIIAAAAVVGLLLGSFTNVLISRVPRGVGVIAGRSACPQCSAEIAWYDNVPVVSWLMLRGRCRHCRKSISWVYPAVELSVAALCVASIWRWGLSVTTAMFFVIAVATVALFVIDFQHKRLPHKIVIPTIAITVILAGIAWVIGERASWWSALVGFLAMAGFYGAIWFVYPRGMGFGDVTTAALIGIAAGFLGYAELAVAALAGPIVGGIMVIALAVVGRVRRKQAVPYGPALIVGAWLGFLWGAVIASAYLALFGVAPT